MSWRHYDRTRAEAYDRERAAPDEHFAEVRALLAAAFSGMPPGPVADIGAGTGLWSDRLRRWLAAPVVALEPSAGMLSVLADKGLGGIHLVRARAEGLPLRDGACGAAWLSTVIHHVDDLAAAAAETARVVAPGGAVLVRSSFPDQGSGPSYPTRFFPSAATVAAEFPPLDTVLEVFGRAGLELRGRHQPGEIAAATRVDLLHRTRQRADSLLAESDDEEFARGFALMRRWVHEAPGEPVHFNPDVLVLRHRR
jgi:SAM-dependent methyltransferase